MVKFDPSLLRYLTKDDFRVLTAIEQGMKNHELVPTVLIHSISKLNRGGVKKSITTIHKNKLVWHDSKKYDGYRLTYGGYDFLAIRALCNRDVVVAVGNKIGVGKESDIYLVIDAQNQECVMKLHRLGRTSFRSIKKNRDYHQHRKSVSWLYLSRLSALKEFAFMRALYDHKFPVPRPIDWNRHCIVMSRVDGILLANVKRLRHPGKVYSDLMNLIIRLAQYGLIHCDFNEFNIMINDREEITLIDFPQMVSTSHPNAETYFNRDVQCIRTYFEKRFGFISLEWPKLHTDTKKEYSLDIEVAASGFTKEDEELYETLAAELRAENAENGEIVDSDESEDTDSDWESVSSDSDEESHHEAKQPRNKLNEEEEEETNLHEELAHKLKPNRRGPKDYRQQHHFEQEESSEEEQQKEKEIPKESQQNENGTADQITENMEDAESSDDDGEVNWEDVKKKVKRNINKKYSKVKVKRNTEKSKMKKEHRDIVKTFSGLPS